MSAGKSLPEGKHLPTTLAKLGEKRPVQYDIEQSIFFNPIS